MKELFVGRSGEVENTTFTILSPDGKRELLRTSRGPDHLFRDAADMAARLRKIAAGFDAKTTPTTLPLIGDERLALNVASADNIPLVVLLGDVNEEVIAKLAWSDAWHGRFAFVKAAKLTRVNGVKITAGVVVVAPETFGRSGTVLAQGMAADAPKLFNEALQAWKPETKTFGGHVREGRREGIFWETKTPVTDPMEARARRR